MPKCCCNCISQIEVKLHRANTLLFQTGIMYVCSIEHELDRNYKGTYSNLKHGLCELYLARAGRDINPLNFEDGTGDTNY